MERKWTSTKNSMVYITARAFPDEDYQYKDNRDYNCNDLQYSHHKKHQLLLFMRPTASRGSTNGQRPRTNFQILNYAALFILCPCSCQHYHFYTFFSCTINRLQKSWFFYNPNSAQNYTQCSLEKQISQGSMNGLTYESNPTSHLHIYSLQLLCMVSLLSFYQLLMLMALSKEKVICKILGYK